MWSPAGLPISHAAGARSPFRAPRRRLARYRGAGAPAGRAGRTTLGGTRSTKKFGIGQSVRRKEDDPILRGAGRYVADHRHDGELHAAVLRSPHAHARFRIADVARARGMKGVRLV